MLRSSALVLSLCLSCAAHSQKLDLGLGHVYAKQGDARKFQRMQQNLQRLNPDLAAELAKEQPNKLPRPNQSKS